MINLLTNETLKNWFSKGFQYFPHNHQIISTIGSQPMLEDDFDDYLRANGIKPYPLHESTEILIIGHDGWNEEEIMELLDEREGKPLRVYSQEMFLAYWTTAQDPFEDKEIVEAFAEGHKALEFLKTCWIEWSSTVVSRSSQGGSLSMESPETSVLKELGYTVGKTRGLPVSKRHEILEKAFNSDLNKILSSNYIRYCNLNFPQYLEEWGNPNSQKRLIKMRDFLSTNCKKQKRKDNIKAALDYEEDLAWLDVSHRTGRFKFRLHNAYVG